MKRVGPNSQLENVLLEEEDEEGCGGVEGSAEDDGLSHLAQRDLLEQLCRPLARDKSRGECPLDVHDGASLGKSSVAANSGF